MQKCQERQKNVQPPLFFENSTDFLHYFFDFQKKKKKKGGFKNFRIKKSFRFQNKYLAESRKQRLFFLWPNKDKLESKKIFEINEYRCSN